MQSITRRDLVKGTAGAAAVVAAAGVYTSIAQAQQDQTYGVEVPLPSFFVKPDPITDIAETFDYDVVVIGAGAAGVPAALAAFEGGASVAVLQKESVCISQGNGGAGVDLANSDPAGLAALVSFLVKENARRSPRELIQAWVDNSGEAMSWLAERSEQAGAQFTFAPDELDFYGFKVTTLILNYGPKPYNYGDGMIAVAKLAEEQGVDFYYETAGQQLLQDESGAVTGVVALRADGTYAQFNAAKGVIVATGDYQNDYEMCSYYLPDLNNMERKQFNKTGDGHKMIIWAGGKMEDLNHTKMLHDFDAGPAAMCDMPFLAVKDDGTRFCDENEEMSLLNNMLRGPQDCGWYSQIFDNDYTTATEGWPGFAYPEDMMRDYMPEEEGEKKGVFEGLTRTFKADTLEELAAKLELTDVDAFVATVARYNELVEKGADEDFGKDPKFLIPVVNPPFWGIRRHVRVSAICAGVEVNAEQQVLTADGEVIPNLYAAGNVARFYGAVDYPLSVGGLSLGRSSTQGYMCGKALAAK